MTQWGIAQVQYETWNDEILGDLMQKPLPLPPWEGVGDTPVFRGYHEPVHACPFCGGPMMPGCDEDSDGSHRYDGTDTCNVCGVWHERPDPYHPDPDQPYGFWGSVRGCD